MFRDNYFDNKDTKFIDDMINYYTSKPDKQIYTKKTDLLCNKKEKVCICNTHAEDFRKIYDGKNYEQGSQYISWFRKLEKPV